MAGKEYQMAFSIGAKLQGQFGAAFKSAQSSITSLQNTIASLNKQQGDIAAYQKQQKAVEQTRAKLQMLQQQYANLKSSMGENGEASVELKNKMLQKELQIQRTTDRLESQEAQLSSTGNALREAGVDTDNLTAASASLSSEIDNLKAEQEELASSTEESGQAMSSAADSMMEFVSAVGVTAVLKEAYEALKACAEEAIAFEESMAAVRRTVGGDDAFLNDLASSFKQLSTEIPISTAELTAIASTAGQLGIAQSDVESFTTVMAKLATTTDLTANEAATMLAQFANITGVKDYDRLGAVIAELGDATATTASKVVEMSQGMAASASQAGMTSTDIMAIAAALGPLGIEAQAGSTSMSQLISTLYKATETGENLKEFASVAGMSAEQFKQAWADNAVGAMDAFIQGLNDVERNGKSAIVILEELGINNVRQTKAILGLASAGSLLSNTINQASNAWSSNTALNEKAAIMYETTQAKLTMMNNAFSNMKIAVGDAFTPLIAGAATALTGLMRPITEFIEKNPAVVQAVAAAAAVIGTVVGALTAYTVAAKIAAAASALLTASIPGLKVILAVTAGVAALAAGVVLLSSAFGEGQQTMEQLDAEFDNLNEQIQEQQRITDLCDKYKKLQGELHKTKSDVDSLSFDDVDITLTASAEASIVPEDFMVDGADGITLTAEQEATLFRSGFLNPNDEGVKITAGQVADLYEKGFLSPDDKGITLSASQIAELHESGFLSPDDDGIILTAAQTASLVRSGFLNPEDEGITLTAAQTASLFESGFLSPDDKGITLTAAQTASLFASGFMSSSDKGITLTAEQQKTLLAAGFLNPSDPGIELFATAVQNLKAEDFVNNPTLALYATIENLPELQSAADSLGTKAANAKKDFSEAKTNLETMQTRYSELEARLTHAGTAADKSTIQTEMESLSKAIGEQEEQVTALETAYKQADTEYQIAAGVAQDLASKEAELQATKQALIEASGGVISATDAETGSFEDQLEVIEALAAAKKTELQSKLFTNISAQAEKYTAAVKQANETNAQMAPLINQAQTAQKWLGMTADEVNDTYQAMLANLDEMESKEGFDPSNADYQAAINDLQVMTDLMGAFFNLSELAGQDINWVKAFGYLSTNDFSWKSSIEEMNEAISDYSAEVSDANAVQKVFIDNLVSGVKSGSVSLEELESYLQTVFSTTENGGEIVAYIMSQVRGEIEEAADAADDFSDGMEDTADASSDVEKAIADVTAQMDELGKAYHEAYEEAYKSMDGQFQLFEQVDKIVPASVDDMIAALQSQQAYMQEYATNLKEAAKMGVSDGLLAQLSDGSTESAAYLAAIVKNGATKIDELNTSFAAVEEGKAAFADTVAEMETDFSSKMEQLSASLQSTISNMNMSSQAASAAKSTMLSFANAASAMEPTVVAAFKKVADAAKKELDVKIETTDNGIRAYASGTKNAERGFAVVGEEGPELMWMNGGETVLSAHETAALAENRSLDAEPVNAISASGEGNTSTYHIEIKPEYTINGNADTEELRTVLDEQTGNLRGMIEDVLAEIVSDRERSVYA